MKREKKIVTGITVLVILIYTSILIGWNVYTPHETLTIQTPGADNRPEGSARTASDVVIGEFFMRYNEASAKNGSASSGQERLSTEKENKSSGQENTSSEQEKASSGQESTSGQATSSGQESALVGNSNTPSVLTGKWNRFRGERADNIIRTDDKLNLSPDKEFPILWSVETGEGHAAPVIYNGSVYFLDYNEQLSSDALRCFSLETGQELWRRWYRVPIKRNHGFSRTVPAITDNYIITIGPEGHVMCCDPLTGDLKWTIDMQKEFKTEVPFWYTGQCPLIDENVLVLAPAGEEILLAGIDCASGEVVWTTPNTLRYKMSHSSVMPMTLHGKKTYVYIGVGGICGISAEADDRGVLLWETSKWQPSVVAPSPVQISTDQIFMVAGYGSGGALLQVARAGGKWTASVLEQHKPNEGLSSEQQTPILYNNMLISVMPKDGGGHRGKLVYYSPTDLRTPVWTSAADERFGLGPYIIINNNLFVFKDDGELYVYEIQQKSMKLLKKQRIMDGADAWGPMAYADGMLIVRDAYVVKCLKIV